MDMGKAGDDRRKLRVPQFCYPVTRKCSVCWPGDLLLCHTITITNKSRLNVSRLIHTEIHRIKNEFTFNLQLLACRNST